MLTLALLAPVALLVGFFIGSVGVGGVLMVPAFVFIAALPIHEAAASSLFLGAFGGIWGVAMFARSGQMSWPLAIPVSAGAALGSVPGAIAAAHIDPRPLAIIIAAVIVSAGLSALRTPAAPIARDKRQPVSRHALMFCIGLASGVGGGLSGSGSAVFAVPVMLSMGYSPVPVVAASTLMALGTALLGSVPHALRGVLNFGFALWATLFLILGMVAGMRFGRRADARLLRYIAAMLCIVVGGSLVMLKH